MKKPLILLLCMMFAASAIGCASHAQIAAYKPSQAPEEAPSNSWDFGAIKEGDIVSHEFILKNTEKKTLTIKEVNTSCGCTVPEIKKKVLVPGESSAIEVKFNSKHYSGWVQQFIFVNTDSPVKPIQQFIIRANVIASAGTKQKK